MPVYNGARYLREAIESILSQTFTDFEFLIINDGSHDDSQAILESYADRRIRLLVNGSNQGISAALNLGLAQARGTYVARQDADDVSHPSRLARQVAFLEAQPAIALLGTQARFWKQGVAPARTPSMWRALSHEAIKFQAVFGNPFFHTAVMYRRAVAWSELNGYCSDYRICQDFDLWLRMLQRHRVANLGEYLVDFRVHPHSICRTSRTADQLAREQLLRHHLATLIADCSGLEPWPRLWATAYFRGSQVAREELHQTVKLARLCLRRSLPGADDLLRPQLWRVYAGYLLNLAAAQRSFHSRFAWGCALRASCASPILTITSTLEWSRVRIFHRALRAHWKWWRQTQREDPPARSQASPARAPHH
jgi:glycosyltransferase involved in cell wall biosynthesis